MIVRNNPGTQNIANRLNNTTNQLWKTSSNIASGSRINRASADAAGLAIAMKMRTQIGGTGQALRNVADGMSLLQTAEGALGGTQTMLGRIEMLSLQAANGTLTNEQRGFIQQEIDQIKSEINRVASATNFNGINLLDGSLSAQNGGLELVVDENNADIPADTDINGDLEAAVKPETGLTLQIGANGVADQRVNIEIEAMSSRALRISGLDVTTAGNALNAINDAARASAAVSEQRAALGAAQNRLEHTANNLITTSYNMTASKSRIADADMAAEIIALTANNIKQQAQIAMMSHDFKNSKGVWNQLLNNTPVSFKA
ncbi:MAG: flagellin [Oscillospiraceae bacterium]|nr:flagellin [Oscillospiraceae bacterium]